MKMLILGSAGQLGTEWCSYVEEKKSIKGLPFNSSTLDITNERKIYTTIRDQRPEVIINCAAYTAVDQAEDEREKAQAVNTRAVRFLAETCTSFNIRLLHYSTDYVFSGSEEDRRYYPEGYTEEAPANPINWYGQTKWEGEQAIRKAGTSHIIIRVSWLCGQYGDNFIKTMLRLGRQQAELEVVDDQFGSPTFAANVVDNSFVLLREAPSGTYHLTSGGLITWFDFAEKIFSLTGLNVRVRPVPSDKFLNNAIRPVFSKLCTRKIEGIPGIKLLNWDDGLKQLLKQQTKD